MFKGTGPITKNLATIITCAEMIAICTAGAVLIGLGQLVPGIAVMVCGVIVSLATGYSLYCLEQIAGNSRIIQEQNEKILTYIQFTPHHEMPGNREEISRPSVESTRSALVGIQIPAPVMPQAEIAFAPVNAIQTEMHGTVRLQEAEYDNHLEPVSLVPEPRKRRRQPTAADSAAETDHAHAANEQQIKPAEKTHHIRGKAGKNHPEKQEKTASEPDKPEMKYTRVTARNVKKGSTVLLVSVILGTLYAIGISVFFFARFANPEGPAVFGVQLLTNFTFYHIVACAIAAIIGWICFFTKIRPLALVSAILYAVAGGLCLKYLPFVLPVFVLAIIAFVRMGQTRVAYDIELSTEY